MTTLVRFDGYEEGVTYPIWLNVDKICYLESVMVDDEFSAAGAQITKIHLENGAALETKMGMDMVSDIITQAVRATLRGLK